MTELEQKIIEHLKLREGEKLHVYLDTQGHKTVGVGHLVLPEDELSLGDKISQTLSDAFLKEDMRKALAAAIGQSVEIGISTDDFLIALTSVNFQLGTNWPETFYGSYPTLVDGDWEAAIAGFKASKWASQTPVRVNDFVKAIEKAYNEADVVKTSQPIGEEIMSETTLKSGVKTSEFWSSVVTTIVTAGITIANETWGWGLNAADILAFLSPILAYIFGRPIVKAIAA